MKEAIQIIKKLPNNKNKIKVILLFLTELSANIQNCNSVGNTWGAWWEEVGANKRAWELVWYKNKLEGILIDM